MAAQTTSYASERAVSNGTHGVTPGPLRVMGVQGRHWLDYDYVAIAVLVIGTSIVIALRTTSGISHRTYRASRIRGGGSVLARHRPSLARVT